MGGINMEVVQNAAQIPNSFYVIAGTLVVANIGTIVGVFVGLGKLIWFMAQLDARVSKVEGDVKAAHDRIRELQTSC